MSTRLFNSTRKVLSTIRIRSMCSSFASANDPCRLPLLDQDTIVQFQNDGYIHFEELLDVEFCAALNNKLEKVLRGEYDVQDGKPDKVPKFNYETRRKKGKVPPALGGPSSRTLQIINIWKGDSSFRSLVLSPTLGEAVATLGGWDGARVANDQVWAKPPGASPLTFHRDSGYFDFIPHNQVITVWIALDDMDSELGPLQYCPGSHQWKDHSERQNGSMTHFFGLKDHTWPLLEAAKLEGIDNPEVIDVTVRAGGVGIHNGRLWHGSGKNNSKTRPRRGIGIHFIPSHARLRSANGWTHAHKFRGGTKNAIDNELKNPIQEELVAAEERGFEVIQAVMDENTKEAEPSVTEPSNPTSPESSCELPHDHFPITFLSPDVRASSRAALKK